MTISVAMCTYNGAKYIQEQLDSILNQQLSKDIDLEVVIVDDNSLDDTVGIIKKLQLRNNNINLYQNGDRLGYIKNFEKAISLCKGEYILTSDQDDVWMQDKIITLIDIFDENTVLVYSDALLVDENLKSLDRTLLENTVPMQGENNLYFLFNNSVSGNTMMFKKEVLNYILPFPFSINFHDLWIAFVASTLGEVKYCSKSLIQYRQHNRNVTNILKNKNKKDSFSKIELKNKSMERRSNIFNIFDAFLKSNIIVLESNILDELAVEFSKYKDYYINIKIFKILYGNRDRLFVTKKQKNIINILKHSFGLKMYKILPFL